MISKVLVVDDSQVDRSRLSELLRSSGYNVKTAEDGQIGVDSAKSNVPDLIFMDVNMPNMDGFAATRALKGDEETKNIPVVLVTSKDQKADKAWGKMLGAKGYITKPYTDNEVLDLLKSL